MARSNPPRKRPQKGPFQIRPQFVPHVPGQVVAGRGTVWHPTPKRERTLSRLDIVELPDGRIQVPSRHLSLEQQALVPRGQGFQIFRDPNAAIRAMGQHIPQGVKNETRRMHKLFNELRGFHSLTLEQWNQLPLSKRTQLINRIDSSVRLLAKELDQMQSEVKIQALDRIDRAVELLVAGNSQAGITTLRAAAMDVLQRYNELLSQRAYLPRREKSLRQHKHEREGRIFTGLDALLGEFDKFSRFSKLTPGDRVRFNQVVGNWSRYFGSPRWKGIKLFSQAGAHLSKAHSLIKSNDAPNAREEVRAACRDIVEEVSKSADLYPDRIRLIRLSENRPWKMRVMGNQANLVAENISLWNSRGFPEGFGKVPAFFDAWAQAALAEHAKDIAGLWIKAKTAFSLGNIGGCKRTLERIVRVLPAK